MRGFQFPRINIINELGKASKKKYDKLGLLAEAWGGRGQVGAGGPNLLSVFLFIGVILSRGLET